MWKWVKRAWFGVEVAVELLHVPEDASARSPQDPVHGYGVGELGVRDAKDPVELLEPRAHLERGLSSAACRGDPGAGEPLTDVRGGAQLRKGV